MRPALAFLSLFLLLIAALAGCASNTGPAAPLSKEVTLDNQDEGAFHPASLTVHVGDTVTFRVVQGTHTLDFDDVAGVSSPHQDTLAAGAVVKVTFSQAGTFRYHCQYHLPGMRGTITVQ